MQSSSNSGRDGVCLTKGVRPSSAALCQPAGPALGPLSQCCDGHGQPISCPRFVVLCPRLCICVALPPFALLQEVGSIHLVPPFKHKLVDRQYVSTDQSGAHLLILYFCLCDCHCQILWRGRRSFVSPRDQITILGNHSLADSQSFDDRGVGA